MSFFRALFGPSKEQVWTELAHEVEGRFLEGGLFSADAVQVRAGDWIITLDTYTVSTGQSSQTYTRLRAPYVNPERFHFRIYRSSMFSGLGKLFGMQDIEVGHEVFDRDFVIQGTSARRVRGLFENSKIRALIQQQPRIDLRVKDDEGWFQGKFPDGVDELCFVCGGVIKDLTQLRGLFELFAEVLNQLCHEGKAYDDDVDLHIERLKGPGGRIESKLLLWEGDEPRRHAAEALGHLGDSKAVPVLASVLRDVDPEVRAKAIAALASIAHHKAVRPLIPLLGDTLEVDGQRIRDRAADALRNMSEHLVVDAVLEAFEGRYELLQAYDGDHGGSIMLALTEALGGFSSGHAARALAGMHAVEALPRLRETLRRLGKRSADGQAIMEAIETLESRASLPRPADSVAASVETLPRAAEEPSADMSRLPKASGGDDPE